MIPLLRAGSVVSEKTGERVTMSKSRTEPLSDEHAARVRQAIVSEGLDAFMARSRCSKETVLRAGVGLQLRASVRVALEAALRPEGNA